MHPIPINTCSISSRRPVVIAATSRQPDSEQRMTFWKIKHLQATSWNYIVNGIEMCHETHEHSNPLVLWISPGIYKTWLLVTSTIEAAVFVSQGWTRRHWLRGGLQARKGLQIVDFQWPSIWLQHGLTPSKPGVPVALNPKVTVIMTMCT